MNAAAAQKKRKLTDREAWLIATHIPLDDTVLKTAGETVRLQKLEVDDEIERSMSDEITRLLDGVFTSGVKHARALMADIVSTITGVTIQADAVQAIECGKLLNFLQMAYSEGHFEGEAVEYGEYNFHANKLVSFDDYCTMCFKHAFPMFLEAEIETRGLIEIYILWCMEEDDPLDDGWPRCAPLFCNPWPNMVGIPQRELACLSCIPSSSLIVEHNLVQLLVELDDLEDAPMPMVCKAWRDAWYEIYDVRQTDRRRQHQLLSAHS